MVAQKKHGPLITAGQKGGNVLLPETVLITEQFVPARRKQCGGNSHHRVSVCHTAVFYQNG